MRARSILTVGQSPQFLRALAREGVRAGTATTNDQIIPGLYAATWDACILDGDQLEADEFHLIRLLRRTQPNLAVVVAGRSEDSLKRLTLLSGADGAMGPDKSARWLRSRLEVLIQHRHALARGLHKTPERQVLVLDWDPVPASVVRGALEKEGFEVRRARDPWHVLEMIRDEPIGVLLAPACYPTPNVSLVESALRYRPRLQVLVASDVRSPEDAVRALGLGASSYLLNPIGPRQAVEATKEAWKAYSNTSTSGERIQTRLRALVLSDSTKDGMLLQQLLSLDQDMQISLQLLSIHDEPRPATDVVVASVRGDQSSALAQLYETVSEFAGIPVVLVSNHDGAEFVERAFASHAEDVLKRDTIGQQSLHTRVRNAHRRSMRTAMKERFISDLQLREASQLEIVGRSLDGMLVVDNRGFVVFANPAAEGMLALESGTLVGSQCPVVLSTQLEKPAATDGGTVVTFLGNLCAEVTQVEVSWDGAPATLVSVRDVTERKKAQRLTEQLHHAERLAAIGQLAAGVTHEINNPAAYVLANLVAMKNQIAQVQKSKTPLDLPELEQMIHENIDGIERIKSIARDLKNFARIDSSQVDNVSVNDCVRAACKIAASALRPKARLVEELSDLPRISGSAGKLAQVLINLLVNAAHAIPEGDPDRNLVQISTRIVDKQIHITVEDTGPGLAPELWETVFQPFFTTKPGAQGLGLGLSLCEDIVTQHGGNISVSRSKLGGAAFDIHLPTTTGLVASQRPDSGIRTRSQLRKLKILVVDDEPLIRRSFSRMLSRHDLTLTEGGLEAIEHLEKDFDYDIVLCDLMMPKMDGVTLFQVITERWSRLARRVVFCSGGAFTPRAKQFLEESSQPIIEKPVDLNVFSRAVIEVLPSAQLVGEEKERQSMAE